MADKKEEFSLSTSLFMVYLQVEQDGMKYLVINLEEWALPLQKQMLIFGSETGEIIMNTLHHMLMIC